MSFSPAQMDQLTALYARLGEDLNFTTHMSIEIAEIEFLNEMRPMDKIPGSYTFKVVIISGKEGDHPWERDMLANIEMGYARDTYDFLIELEQVIRRHPPMGMPFDTNRGESWRNMAWSNLKNGTTL